MVRLFNLILDKVTGFNLTAELSEVLKMDKWSRQEIEAYQKNKFNILKGYACKSEIYKNCKEWDFKDFPKYSKDDYKLNHEKFRTNFRKPYRIESTSGSTGVPRKIVVSKEMIQAKRVSHLKMLKWFGVKREDFELYIGGMTKNLKMKIYYKLKNKYFLSSYNINREKALEYIKILNKKKPRILFSYPYALNMVLNYIDDPDIKLHQPKVIYTGAENLYPDIEKQIRKHFPESALVNEYWSTEGNIGVACPEGNMHVDEDTVIVEVDNTDNNGVGDLLITNLYSYDSPIIRYRIGDRIKLSDKFCKCGRKTKIIEKIEGRDIDYFMLKDGRKIAFTENSIQIAGFCDNILAYQVIHKKLTDEVLFKYIIKDKSKPVMKESISNYFLENLKLNISFQEVAEIETEASGKHKIFKTV